MESVSRILISPEAVSVHFVLIALVGKDTNLSLLTTHHHHHHIALVARYPWPSLATPPYRSSLLVGLQDKIPYPHIAAECMFVLVVLLLHGHVWGSIGVHLLWVRPCFSSSGVLHVWFDCRLFNAKSFLYTYIKYISSKYNLYIIF